VTGKAQLRLKMLPRCVVIRH